MIEENYDLKVHIKSATNAMAAYRSVTVLGRAGPRRLPAFRAQSTLVSDMAPMPSVAKELFLGRLDPRVLSFPDVISSNPARMHKLNVRCRYVQGDPSGWLERPVDLGLKVHLAGH